MKKLLSIILLLCMVFSIVACTKEKNGDGTGSTTVDGVKDPVAEKLPDVNYDGTTFRVLGEPSNIQIFSDEDSENKVEAEMHKNHMRIKEKLGIKVDYVSELPENIVPKVEESIASFDGVYDAVETVGMYVGWEITKGLFKNLKEIDEISLDEPWWDGDSAEKLEIDGKLYFAYGDASTHGYFNMWSVFFNEELMEQAGVTEPYKMVRDGEWTIDKMVEISKKVMKDVDNDGVYNFLNGDVCGVMSNNSSFLAFLHSSGESVVTRDENNVPVFLGADEQFVNVYDKLMGFIYNDGVFVDYQKLGQEVPNSVRFGAFTSDLIMFSVNMVGSAINFTDMESDYGVLPLPKYNEDQKEYLNYIGPSTQGFCIPVNAPDAAMSGTILDYYCAYGHEYVIPIYLEETLTLRLMRNDESADIINNYIYKNIDVELGFVYGFDKIYNIFTTALSTGQQIKPMFDAKKESVNITIGSVIEQLNELEQD